MYPFPPPPRSPRPLPAPPAGRPADPPFDSPPDRRVRAATKHQGDPLVIHLARGDRLRAARHRLAAPGAVHQLEGGVPAASAVMESRARGLEVIRPPADAYAEHQTAGRHPGQPGCLPCEERPVPPW